MNSARQQPTFSVITVTRNCVGVLRNCLDSMAGQSWPYREHVVIDGASSDGTVELLEARRDSLSVLISEADRGIYDALNKGLIYARGDVVGFLHADDVYASPDTLSRVAQEFANPAVGAVYGDLRYVWKDRPDRFVRYWHSRPYTVNLLRRGWMPPHPTLYVRREWYERVGSFDTRYRISADYDHIVRLFSQSDLNPVYIPEVLVHMRTGGASNRSFGAIARKSCEDLNILRHHGVGGLGTLALKNLSKLGQFRYGFP